MESLEALAPWFHSAWAESFVNYGYMWGVCETLHFMGLALLVGITGLVDLRMLGVAKELPFGRLHRLIPWAIGGFGLALVTGLLFFTSAPGQYLGHWAFPLKMLFILLAGVNVGVFYLTVFRRMENLGPGEEAPPAAKAIGAVSLVLWIGVIFFGRMLGF